MLREESTPLTSGEGREGGASALLSEGDLVAVTGAEGTTCLLLIL